MNTFITGISFLILTEFIVLIFGNGRLLVPPQRSSLWRDPQFYRFRYVYRNYNDHTLNCGGFWRMHENRKKCGVCGDPWDAEKPRPNEAGGIYARGIIGRTYSIDKRFIDAVIQVTSSISGYFEFNICPNNNITKRVSRECLDNFPLRILSKDRTTSYGRRYIPDIPAGQPGVVELSLEIPEYLECTQCVLQWRWHGANNYGMCRNGRWGKGCGDQPEIFNCADIAILPDHMIKYEDKVPSVPVVPRPRPIIPSPTSRPTTPPITTRESVIEISSTRKIPTTTFKSMPTTSSVRIPTSTFKSLPTTRSETIPTTTFKTMSSTTSDTVPTTTFKSVPTTNSDTVPTTTFKSLRTTTSETITTTTFKSMPTTKSKTIPKTTSKSMPTTTSKRILSLLTTTFEPVPTTNPATLPTTIFKFPSSTFFKTLSTTPTATVSPTTFRSVQTTTSKSVPTTPETLPTTAESVQTTSESVLITHKHLLTSESPLSTNKESLSTTTSKYLPYSTTESLSKTTPESLPSITSESVPPTTSKSLSSPTSESLLTTQSESVPPTTSKSLSSTTFESLLTTQSESVPPTTQESIPTTSSKLLSKTSSRTLSTTVSPTTTTSYTQPESTTLLSVETETNSTSEILYSTSSFMTPTNDSENLGTTKSTELSSSSSPLLPPSSTPYIQDFTSSTLPNIPISSTGTTQHSTINTASSTEEENYVTNFNQTATSTSSSQSTLDILVSDALSHINSTYSTILIDSIIDVTKPPATFNSTASTTKQTTATLIAVTENSTVVDKVTNKYQNGKDVQTVKPAVATNENTDHHVNESAFNISISLNPSVESVTEQIVSVTQTSTRDHKATNDHTVPFTTSDSTRATNFKENITQSQISGSSTLTSSKPTTTESFIPSIEGLNVKNDIIEGASVVLVNDIKFNNKSVKVDVISEANSINNSAPLEGRFRISNTITEGDRHGQRNNTDTRLEVDNKGVVSDGNAEGKTNEPSLISMTELPPIFVNLPVDNIANETNVIITSKTEQANQFEVTTDRDGDQDNASRNQTLVPEVRKENTTPVNKNWTIVQNTITKNTTPTSTNKDIELLGLLNAMIEFESRTNRTNGISSFGTNELTVNETDASKEGKYLKKTNQDQTVPATTPNTLSFELFRNTSPVSSRFPVVTQSLFRPRGVTSRSTIFRGKLGGRLGNGISVATLFPISRLMDIDLHLRN